MPKKTRRQFLRVGGATAVASVGIASLVTSAQTESSDEWSAVESPTTGSESGSSVEAAKGESL
ncbi:hypothetical protein [Haladaptatus cibarius]|uniref:hypothetical protein n=1 Tax=Haladaptatus cibarius TaxID=453847 RepID=UPI0006793C87|nr:hypothetical protein [Haladaptatus cibarius]